MNRIKRSIINKVGFLIILILLAVGGILTVNAISFFDVKNSLESMIDHDVARITENTRLNDNLRNSIAQSELLINTFTERRNTLVDEKDRLIEEIKADIEHLNTDRAASEQLFKSYLDRLTEIFDDCERINGLLTDIGLTEMSLDTELAALDDTVIEKELTVADEDSAESASINQLAIMLPGYREIFFEIILEFINARIAYLSANEIKQNHEQRILTLLEEFDIGLRSMPIAWKEVIPFIRKLTELTAQYNSLMVEVFQNMREFHDHYVDLKRIQKGIITETASINDQIIKNTQAIRTKTTSNITASIRTTMFFSGTIIVILFIIGALTIKLVHPIKSLSAGAEKIGAGDLDYKVTIASDDEIGQLAESFNRMTENLLKTTVSKDYVQNIFDSMNEALIVFTPEGRIESVNRAGYELLGYEESELFGKPAGKIMSEAEALTTAGDIPETTARQSALRNVEKVFVAKDGREIPVLFSRSLMSGSDGSIQGLVCVATDISDLKIAQAALKTSEANYRLLFDAEPDAIIITDAETKRIVEANPAAMRLYRYSQNEICNLQALSLSAEPEISAKHIQKVLNSGNRGEILNSEQRLHRKKDGTEFPVEIATSFYHREGRKMICAIIRDISRRKQIEDELAAEKERLTVTLRSIGDGVISTDLEGRITSVNKVAETLTGWQEEEAIGLPLSKVFHIVNEFDRKPSEDPVRKVLESGGIVGLANHTLLINKDGKEYVIADSGAPIMDSQSNIIGAVLVFRDITEKRKMEQELINVKKLESLGVLAGGIAHDFNNYLTAIIGNLSLAKTETTPGDRINNRLDEMETASLQAKNLTQQLLTFARGGEPVKKRTKLNEVIINSATFSLRGSNVRCEFDISDDLLPADVDEGQIGQVINNLVLNADQSMPEGGIIQIIAESTTLPDENELPLQPGPYIKVSIRDHGVGIRPEDLTKVFDPYFTTKQKGSGLGLTVAYSIIDKHNGRITVNSKLGHGTTFSIYLPATIKTADRTAKEDNRLFTGEGKILVMDDEEFILDVATRMLSKLGYEVAVADDGQKAIEMYRQAQKSGEPFDAVIMDLTVPGGMGGKAAIQKLLDMNPDIKAIVSSGYSNDPIMSNFRGYGFSGVIKKPYRLSDLSEVMRSVLTGQTET